MRGVVLIFLISLILVSCTPTQKEDMGFPDDDFILGSKYISEKDYDKAEEHLKKIKPGSKNYEQAQQLLESIKYLRKYDK